MSAEFSGARVWIAVRAPFPRSGVLLRDHGQSVGASLVHAARDDVQIDVEQVPAVSPFKSCLRDKEHDLVLDLLVHHAPMVRALRQGAAPASFLAARVRARSASSLPPRLWREDAAGRE